MNVLKLSHIRDLEDVIIDAIYRGIIQVRLAIFRLIHICLISYIDNIFSLQGKLDPLNKQVEIEHCSGRDVKVEDLKEITQKLSDWANR